MLFLAENKRVLLEKRYKAALVTGVGSGLGRAFSEMLLKEGIPVWGTSRNVNSLERFSGIKGVSLDLCRPDSIQDLLMFFDDRGVEIDLLINNAGFGVFGSYTSRSFEDWSRQVNGMLTGTMELTHGILKRMFLRKTGSIVTISSLAAEFPIPYMSGYNVVKAGLSAFTESLMIEVEDSEVTVVDFRPGDYVTGFNESMNVEGKAAARESIEKTVWSSLCRIMSKAPQPEKAAKDLRNTLLRGKSGMVRSGSFFQARAAPFLARFGTSSMKRCGMMKYFGIR